MAISYNTKTGNEYINTKARILRDKVLKPQLKGMSCRCGGKAEFTFHQHQVYIGSSSVDYQFHSCCSAFEARVIARLRKH